MFKIRFLLLLAVFTAATAHARSLLEHPHFEMEPGRKIYVEMQRAKGADKPTLLFLPGLFCAPLLTEKFIQELTQAGFGAVIMNFSLQAPSINLLARDVQPLFKQREMTLQDLADEIEFVAKMVRAEFPGIQLIPVSLSFSSTVTPLLKSFNHIIETTPMTSMWASIPDIHNLHSFWNLNPFLSREAVRRLLDQTYFNAGRGITEFTINRYKLPRDRKYEMNEGYETMMRMAEGFDWMNLPIDANVHRDWILAGNEGWSLKNHQQKFLALYKLAQPESRSVEIRGAGHVIMYTQPEKLAEALGQFSTPCTKQVTL